MEKATTGLAGGTVACPECGAKFHFLDRDGMQSHFRRVNAGRVTFGPCRYKDR